MVVNLPNGVMRGQERLYMVVIAKMSNIHAYWPPNGNSHNIALRTLTVSACDLPQYTQTYVKYHTIQNFELYLGNCNTHSTLHKEGCKYVGKQESKYCITMKNLIFFTQFAEWASKNCK
jgi:hypothetical protein